MNTSTTQLGCRQRVENVTRCRRIAGCGVYYRALEVECCLRTSTQRLGVPGIGFFCRRRTSPVRFFSRLVPNSWQSVRHLASHISAAVPHTRYEPSLKSQI
jgi:hypothetical protein